MKWISIFPLISVTLADSWEMPKQLSAVIHEYEEQINDVPHSRKIRNAVAEKKAFLEEHLPASNNFEKTLKDTLANFKRDEVRKLQEPIKKKIEQLKREWAQLEIVRKEVANFFKHKDSCFYYTEQPKETLENGLINPDSDFEPSTHIYIDKDLAEFKSDLNFKLETPALKKEKLLADLIVKARVCIEATTYSTLKSYIRRGRQSSIDKYTGSVYYDYYWDANYLSILKNYMKAFDQLAKKKRNSDYR